MEWLNFIVNNPVFVALADTLMHFAWQGVLLASFLLLLLKSIDNRYSNLRYYLSLLVLLFCVVAPVTTFSLVYNPYIEPVAVDVKQAISQVSTSASQVGAAIGALNEPGHLLWPIATTELLDSSSQWHLETISPFLAIAWMAGVVLMSCRLVLQLVNVYKLPYQGTSAPDVQLLLTFERLMEQLGVSLAARLLISSKVDVPMVIGWLKPVVLLPSAMVVGLTPKQLEMLLAHELAHVRRYDYLVNFLQTLVEVMLFFHPGVKWVSKQIRTERECCCDDVAIAHCGSPVAYASALTDAEMSRYTNIPHLAMAASGSDLKHRVFRAVGQADCSSGFSGHWLSGILAVVLSLTIVFLIFSADVIGMTTHTDKPHKNEQFMVLVEPPANAVEGTSAKLQQTDSQRTDSKPPRLQAPLLTIDTTAEKNPVAQPLDAAKDSAAQPDLVLDTSASELIPGSATLVEMPPETAPESSPDSTEPEAAIQQVATIVRSLASNSSDFAEVTETIDNTATADAEVSLTPLTQPADAEEMAGSDIAQPIIEIASVVVEQPVLLRSSTPSYPSKALQRKWSADVLVNFVVNEKGRVEQIVFDSKVRKVFRDSVKKSLKKWQFQPATENGKPIPMQLSKLFSFSEPVDNFITGSRIAKR